MFVNRATEFIKKEVKLLDLLEMLATRMVESEPVQEMYEVKEG